MLDADGVLYDFQGAFKHYLTEHRGWSDAHWPEPTRWEFYLDLGLTRSSFEALCTAGVEDGVIFTHGDPYPGTREAMQRLTDAGHELHIVTDRFFGSRGCEEVTRKWLTRHGLPFHALTLTGDKAAIPADFAVDDRPLNYAALRNAGVDAYLFIRSWNDCYPAAQRVGSLGEFVDVVLGVAE